MKQQSKSPVVAVVLVALFWIIFVVTFLVLLFSGRNAHAQRPPGQRTATYGVWRAADPRFNGLSYQSGAVLWQSYARLPENMLRRPGDQTNVPDGHPVALRTAAGTWLPLDGLHADRPPLPPWSWNPRGVIEFTADDEALIRALGDGTGYYGSVAIRTHDRGPIYADAFTMVHDHEGLSAITFTWHYLGVWFEAYFPPGTVVRVNPGEPHVSSLASQFLKLCDESTPVAIPCVYPISTRPMRSLVQVEGTPAVVTMSIENEQAIVTTSDAKPRVAPMIAASAEARAIVPEETKIAPFVPSALETRAAMLATTPRPDAVVWRHGVRFAPPAPHILELRAAGFPETTWLIIEHTSGAWWLLRADESVPPEAREARMAQWSGYLLQRVGK